MKTVWRDSIATLLAIFGGVVMFAKLQSYNWWLIGSWTGALGVLAVIGLAIMLTNVIDLARLVDGASLLELVAWVAAATVAVTGLLVVTTKAEFIWSGAIIGLAWLTQLGGHIWESTHTHRPHYIPAG